MYFPGDPLFALDPIYQSITDQKARDRLVAAYDHDVTTHEWATGYRWDVVLTGAHSTPSRERADVMSTADRHTRARPIGPFFGYALPFERDNELVPPAPPGAIRLHGIVTDGAGTPVPDALLEIWQADADGTVPPPPGSLRRDGWTFTGWGRASTDDEGHYSFTTVEPGATQPDSAPFFAVTVFARGLLNRLFTRAYVPDDRLAADRAAELAARRAAGHADRDARRARPAVRHPPAGATVRPRRSSCATRAIDRDRPVLAGRSPRRRPDERCGVPDGDGRRRKRLARQRLSTPVSHRRPRAPI